MSIVRQGTLPVGSLDHAITLNVQSSGGSHFETVTNTTPYLHRASPQDVASSMKLKKVVGGTIAWNQRLNTLSATTFASNNASVSYSNGVATATCSSSELYGIYLKPEYRFTVTGHKYYIACRVTASSGANDIYWGIDSNAVRTAITPNTAKDLTTISNASANNKAIIYYQLSGNTNDTITVSNAMAIDLTQMFGSTIADYIYSLEQAHAGDGVAWFKALFPKAYYSYNAGELISVKTSARKTYNADNVEIGSYPLDGDLELRGIPKLDSNNELYYDGDTYASDGTVTRKYGIRAYTEGDVTDGSTMITDGTNTVYALTIPTTESADAYTQSQRVGATEEFVDGRTVEIPVGNVSEYKRLIQGDTP